jgi:hypothetical protein
MNCTLPLACVLMISGEPIGKTNRVEIFEDPGPGDSWYARAVIHNISGVYNGEEVDNTSHGPLQMRYETTTPNTVGDPASADNACIVFLPDGVSASAMCVTIMEQETETIYLYEYIGG